MTSCFRIVGLSRLTSRSNSGIGAATKSAFYRPKAFSSPMSLYSTTNKGVGGGSSDDDNDVDDGECHADRVSANPNRNKYTSYSSKHGFLNRSSEGGKRVEMTTTAAAGDASINNSIPKEPAKWAKFPDGRRFWKQAKHGRLQRPIFMAATRQHVGKTTSSLAVMSGLKKRFDKVGFIKPVGQQHVEVKSENQNANIRVDKDVCLVREHFGLDHIDYEDMSPVIIPSGYTKKYVDGEITLDSQVKAVEKAMESITRTSDVVLCEGTGHCGVGSIVGLNNAKIASIIGADMVLIANGGLGSAFDELELNRVLCQHYNVRVAGVILNKVIPDKLEQTAHYMRKAMMQTWGVPLLGCIPDRPFLGCPALADLENLFKTELISGQEHRFRHYAVDDIVVVTTSLTRFLENLREKPSRTLYICHVTRDDLIVGFMGEFQRRREKSENPFEAALIICGRRDKYQLSPEVNDMLNSLSGAPVMVVGFSTHGAMSKIHRHTPKLNIHDTNRVGVAVDHYEPYIDFDELMRRTTSDNSSFNDPQSIPYDQLTRV